MARLPERIELKSPDQIALMRKAGLVVADALERMRAAVAPGVSTLDLDAVAREVLRAAGATPSFLGYHGYPAVICASVNDRIVHGIPSAAEKLAPGDLISIDFGAIVEGWHGDAAISVPVGEVAPDIAAAVGHLRGVDVGRARPGPRRRPAQRHLARRSSPPSAPPAGTASSPATAGTASARRCTWRRTSSTTAGPARARG